MPSPASRQHQLVPLAATQAAGLLCGLIGVRWMSAVVPPELLGIYGLLLSTVQLAAVVTHQGFVKHVQRHWTPGLPAKPYVVHTLAPAATRPTLLMIGGLAGMLAFLHFLAGVPANAGVLVWMIVVNLLVAVAQMAQGALQAEERYWASFVASAIASAARSFLPPFLVMVVGASLTVLNAGFLIHAATATTVAVLFLRSAWRRDGSVPAQVAGSLGRMVSTFTGVGLCGWLAASAPRWFAAAILTPEATGYFVLAGNLTLIVPATFGTIAFSHGFPALFQASRAGADDQTLQHMTWRTVMNVLVASQVVLVALAMAAPWLIGWLIDARYTGATVWLLATGGGALAATTTQFFHNLLLAKDRESDCIKLSAVSTGFRLVVMGAGAVRGPAAFRTALILLPWFTVILESWYARNRLKSAVG